MIVVTTRGHRAAQWTGNNQADLVDVCGGRATAPHMTRETSVYIDAWGQPQAMDLGDWVVATPSGLRRLTQRQFANRHRIAQRRHVTEEAAA